jgi:hypothetical protein
MSTVSEESPSERVVWTEPVWSSRAAFRPLLRPAIHASIWAWGVVMAVVWLLAESVFLISAIISGQPVPVRDMAMFAAYLVIGIPLAMAVQLLTSWWREPKVCVTPERISFSQTGWKRLSQQEVSKARLERNADGADVLVLERSTPSAMMRRTVGIPASADLGAIKRVISMWDCNRPAPPPGQPRVREETAAS